MSQIWRFNLYYSGVLGRPFHQSTEEWSSQTTVILYKELLSNFFLQYSH